MCSPETRSLRRDRTTHGQAQGPVTLYTWTIRSKGANNRFPVRFWFVRWTTYLHLTPRCSRVVICSRYHFQAFSLWQILQPILNRTEVSSLFSHPLQSFLSTTAPSPPKLRRSASKSDSEDEYADVEALAVSEYYSYNDIPWFGWRRTRPTSSPTSNETVPVGFSTRPPSGDGSGSGNTHKRMKGSEVHQGKRMIRMHRFLTGREAGGVKPVFGLTAYVFAP